MNRINTIICWLLLLRFAHEFIQIFLPLIIVLLLPLSLQSGLFRRSLAAFDIIRPCFRPVTGLFNIKILIFLLFNDLFACIFPKLLFDLSLIGVVALHLLHALSSSFCMVYDGSRVVFADHASKLLLSCFRGHPRLVDVLRRIVFQLWAIFLDIGSLLVVLLIECLWRVNSVVLVEESACTQPLPVRCVQGPVCVDQVLFKYFSS